jgi:hypothetical protein
MTCAPVPCILALDKFTHDLLQYRLKLPAFLLCGGINQSLWPPLQWLQAYDKLLDLLDKIVTTTALPVSPELLLAWLFSN